MFIEIQLCKLESRRSFICIFNATLVHSHVHFIKLSIVKTPLIRKFSTLIIYFSLKLVIFVIFIKTPFKHFRNALVCFLLKRCAARVRMLLTHYLKSLNIIKIIFKIIDDCLFCFKPNKQ